jgi:hypothetical protein
MGVAFPLSVSEVVIRTDWAAVWEGEVPVVVVWEVDCRVGSGVAAVLNEVEGVAMVVKALYSCVLSRLSAQAR